VIRKDIAGSDVAPSEDIPRIGGPTSRRRLLKAGVCALAVIPLHASMLSMANVAVARGPSAAVSAEKFMTASRLLVQHRLSPGIGARMAGILSARVATLDTDLDAIIAIAKQKQAKAVEDFFEALPDGHVKETAHQIIFGWYAGVVDDSPNAEVFAYEEALMYQPTRDAIPIPTYSLDGPDDWTNIDPPLAAMPEF